MANITDFDEKSRLLEEVPIEPAVERNEIIDEKKKKKKKGTFGRHRTDLVYNLYLHYVRICGYDGMKVQPFLLLTIQRD
jgi:hypothetical protein